MGTGGLWGLGLYSWKTLTPQMMAAHWPIDPSDVMLYSSSDLHKA